MARPGRWRCTATVRPLTTIFSVASQPPDYSEKGFPASLSASEASPLLASRDLRDGAISSTRGAPKLPDESDAIVDRADGNRNEHGE